MLTLPDGQLALQRAAASLPREAYGDVLVAVRADHEAKYQATDLLKRVFGSKIEVLVLQDDTRGPADTVARMLRHAAVAGAFAVKDATASSTWRLFRRATSSP